MRGDIAGTDEEQDAEPERQSIEKSCPGRELPVKWSSDIAERNIDNDDMRSRRLIAGSHPEDRLIDQINDQPVRGKLVIVAEHRDAMHLTRQRRLRPVSVSVNYKGGHGRSMEALRNKCAGLKPKMIFDAQMTLQQGVAGDWNTIEKRKDRVCGDRSRGWSGSSWQEIIGVNPGDDTLWANVHDRLDTGQAARRTLYHSSNGCDWQFSEDSVVRDVIQPGATEKLAAALADRRCYRRFTDRTCLGGGPKHEFDFERNELVIPPTFDLFNEDIRIQRLDAIGRTPNTKVTKTSEDVPPRGKSLW